jgi:hypothetical protein
MLLKKQLKPKLQKQEQPAILVLQKNLQIAQNTQSSNFGVYNPDCQPCSRHPCMKNGLPSLCYDVAEEWGNPNWLTRGTPLTNFISFSIHQPLLWLLCAW